MECCCRELQGLLVYGITILSQNSDLGGSSSLFWSKIINNHFHVSLLFYFKISLAFSMPMKNKCLIGDS